MISRFHRGHCLVLQRWHSSTIRSEGNNARIQLLTALKGKSHREFCRAMRTAGKLKLHLSHDELDKVLRGFFKFSDKTAFNAFDICDVMVGTVGMNNIAEVPSFRMYVSGLVKSCKSCSGDINVIHMSQCFHGMQHFPDKGNVCELLDVFADILSKKTNDLTPRVLGTMLNGMRSMQALNASSERILSLILDAVNQRPETWNNRDIGAAYTGLRNKGSNSTVVRQLVLALTHKLEKMTEPVTALTVATALHSLKNMNDEHEEIQQTLDIIASRLDGLSFGRNHLAMAFSGLRNMSNGSTTRRLLRCLSNQLEACPDLFSPQEIASILYGIKDFSLYRAETNTGAVRAVLRALLPHIRSSVGAFHSQTFGNCLYSMNNKSSDVVEVRNVIRELLGRFQHSGSIHLEPLALSTALYGMKSMHTSQLEVRMMLAYIAQKMESCSNLFRAGDVAMAMLGLVHCDSDFVETRQVVKNLTKFVSTCADDFSLQQISYCMLGMRHMSDVEPEVQQLLDVFVKKFFRGRVREMKSKELAACLCGMNRLHISQPNTQILLERYLTMDALIKEAWLVADISDAFTGLASMTDDHPLVRQAIMSLLQRAMNAQDKWNVDVLSSCFLGFASMSSNTAEVVSFLQFAVGEFVMLDARLTSLQIGLVLGSMSNMNSSNAAVRSLLVLLMESLNDCKSAVEVKSLERSFFGIRNMSSEHVEVVDLLQALTRHLKSLPRIDEVSLNYFLEGLCNKDLRSAEVREAYEALRQSIEASSGQWDTSLIACWEPLQKTAKDCEQVALLVKVVQDKSLM